MLTRTPSVLNFKKQQLEEHFDYPNSRYTPILGMSEDDESRERCKEGWGLVQGKQNIVDETCDEIMGLLM